ncbi:Rieske [2Fe-2S] domain-containing protein [Prosthecobacter debontii]|uniref:Rieske [2Fe-2S] domain-containing protein n=1 Tax=Prosthecobacter debontii TaxID=48467 RepID=A0A1T4YK63_9BACT|nr:Rieske 2Fe-2S domain-containing protein [Prosthecobacter debontii]SKB02073.1 Rieske [2Fe-2S] domain-containing protein [Prosthecobacter debontii]
MSSSPCRTCLRPCNATKPERSPPSLELLSRREWVKRFALGSAVALGSAWKGQLLADISPTTASSNIITLKIGSYAALQNSYGSMRFSIFGESVPDGVILVTRAPGNVFHVVSAHCTHEGCTVEAYNPNASVPSIECLCHGSVYDIQGRVITGAMDNQEDLPTYNTTYANGDLHIEIPNLNLKVNQVTLASFSGNNKRLRLSFPARKGGIYKLSYTPDLKTAPTSVMFSTTANGAINTSQVIQSADATRHLWVASTAKRGFYLVELLVQVY